MSMKESFLYAGLIASISVSLLVMIKGIVARDQLFENWVVMFIVAFFVIKFSGANAKNKGE